MLWDRGAGGWGDEGSVGEDVEEKDDVIGVNDGDRKHGIVNGSANEAV